MKNSVITTISMCLLTALGIMFLSANDANVADAHCQVPCGIYDDPARINGLKEDAATIEKAMKLINELGGKHDAKSINQVTRWIHAKEQHASNVITVVAEYFLTQKIKPVAKDSEGYDTYLSKLADHHAVMSAAMKTKQNTDLAYVVALKSAIDALGSHY